MTKPDASNDDSPEAETSAPDGSLLEDIPPTAADRRLAESIVEQQLFSGIDDNDPGEQTEEVVPDGAEPTTLDSDSIDPDPRRHKSTLPKPSRALPNLVGTDIRELAATAFVGGTRAPRESPRRSTPPRFESTPTVPDKYSLERKIGEGGFGVVYLARDHILNRPVALKFLSHARPADLERFRREARVTARLTDANIVQVFELDENDGAPFIAMQYIEGAPISRELPLPQLLAAMIDIGHALARVHREGIVHRDLKPGNILLDESGRAYLTDFGIAREIFRDSAGTVSSEGFVVGTPALMSPEQARAEHAAVDARSDIYSFGATLYCLLTGRAPFQGDSVVEVLHAVIHDAPPLPRSIVADIPRSLEDVVLKCMSKTRRDRYPSMEPLVRALESTRADTTGGDSQHGWFRRLVGAEVLGSGGLDNGGTDLSTATAPEASEEIRMALDITRELGSWQADLYRVRTRLAPAYRKLDALVARLDAVLSQRPDSGWARFYRGVAFHRQGRLQDAREEMERCIDRVFDRGAASFELGQLYLDLYLREHRAAHAHIVQQGTVHHLRGALSILHKAVIAFDEARRWQTELPPWQVQYAQAVAQLSSGDSAACVETCDAILADDPDLEQVWRLAGVALSIAGDDPRDRFERAVDIRRSDLESWMGLATAHFARGEFESGRDAVTTLLQLDPDHAEGQSLLVRSYLLQSLDAAGDRSLIAEGLSRARQLQADSDREAPYELEVTHIELATIDGCNNADESSLAEALDAVERARLLRGCQNRVNLLEAKARLARARIRCQLRQPYLSDLDVISRFESQHRSMGDLQAPWVEVFEQAQELRAHRD